MALTAAQQAIREIYDWMPRAALSVFLTAYVESGNEDTAMAAVRDDSRYGQWFPGNLTEDGRPVHAEGTYAGIIAGYEAVFQSVGIGPDVFRSRYGELIQGDVSVTELRQDRVQPMYERIIEASEPIKAEYSAMYGVELTTEGLLAAALDPEMGESILAGQITMAEISGEARESGFALPQELTEQMYRTGKVDRAAADTLFMSAANLVPALNVLTRRHADPDDTFDLEEFVAADLFEDPTQRRRMRRLVNQERASFTGGRPGTLSTLQTGGVTGLRAR